MTEHNRLTGTGIFVEDLEAVILHECHFFNPAASHGQTARASGPQGDICRLWPQRTAAHTGRTRVRARPLLSDAYFNMPLPGAFLLTGRYHQGLCLITLRFGLFVHRQHIEYGYGDTPGARIGSLFNIMYSTGER